MFTDTISHSLKGKILLYIVFFFLDFSFLSALLPESLFFPYFSLSLLIVLFIKKGTFTDRQLLGFHLLTTFLYLYFLFPLPFFSVLILTGIFYFFAKIMHIFFLDEKTGKFGNFFYYFFFFIVFYLIIHLALFLTQKNAWSLLFIWQDKFFSEKILLGATTAILTSHFLQKIKITGKS